MLSIGRSESTLISYFFLFFIVSKRLKRWKAKTEPDLVAQAYTASREVQLALGSQAQLELGNIVARVRDFIEKRVRNPAIKQMYLAYSHEVGQIPKKYKGKLADIMAASEAIKWMLRGLDINTLKDIARLFNLNIGPIIEEIMLKKVELETIPIDREVQITETGVEVTLVEFIDDRVQRVETYIDLQPMGSDDIVQIIEYVRVQPDGDFRKFNDEDIYVDKLSAPLIRIPDRLIRYGYKVTIRSLKYAPRTIKVHGDRVIFGS